jgi:cation diffusion facilitator family transporter
MDTCCEVRPVPAAQRAVLQATLWINAVMFLIECGAGVAANSTALLADSVDMLGDAIVYGFSLYAVGRGLIWQSRAAFLKGLIMAGFGGGILVQVALKLTRGLTPGVETMGIVGLVALAANLVCLRLLWRHREDDVNMRSAWICSRNDVIGNVSVLVAAGAIWLSGSPWPDIIVGLLVASVFCRSAVGVLADASRAHRGVA